MYVVYNENTTAVVDRYRYYRTAAKKAAYRNSLTDTAAYVAVHADFHQLYIRHRVTRKSVMGPMFEEWSDTPYYLSPSSETYWSA